MAVNSGGLRWQTGFSWKKKSFQPSKAEGAFPFYFSILDEFKKSSR
jgi:hypothetical protein